MDVFLVVLEKENQEVSRRIEQYYPDNHKISEILFLVSTDSSTTDIAINIGIRGNPNPVA